MLLNFTTIIFSKCCIHGKNPSRLVNKYSGFQGISDSEGKLKLYTKKEFLLFEEYISNFHYEHTNQKYIFSFYLPHVKILGTNDVIY